MVETEGRGLRLLAIDGGGIRGLSSLFILQVIMVSIKNRLNLPRVPHPCEYFDLIGGTSTGGLIALMLGRLRMSVDDAICAYTALSKKVFSKVKIRGDGKYKATNLEAAVRKIVEKYTHDPEATMLDLRPEDTICRVFVCAVPATSLDARMPSIIRSYEPSSERSIPCTIVQAARATTAAPTFFKRAVINDQGIDRAYLDGGVVQNNPANVVLQEANRVFGKNRKVSCLVSIGTGKLRTNHVPKQGLFDRFIPVDVARAMAKIATDTEETHQALQHRFNSRPGIYFRFTVDEGMQDIGMDEWNKLDGVMSHTEKYLRSEDVRPKLELAVKALAEQQAMLTVSEANGVLSAEDEPRNPGRRSCPRPSRVFTGRQDILSVMDDYFSKANNDQRMFVLYGMGGSGKSEIMKMFVAQSRASTERDSRFSEVFYVDASSKDTIRLNLDSIAQDKKLGDNYQQTIDWLVRTHEHWLLVLDNADDPTLNLRPFIPQCSHGNIIITTRNEQLRIPEKSCQILRMPQHDAKALFLRRSLIKNPDDEETDKLITELIEELDALALGIVQAAAYLHVNPTCTLRQYLARFRSDRQKALEASHDIINRPDDYERTVYTTWNISLEQLSAVHPEAATFLYLCSFLHHKNISKSMFTNAASSAVSITPNEAMSYSLVQEFLAPFIAPTAETSDAFDRIVASLCSYSLVEITPEGHISFHRLVQDWGRRHASTTTPLRPIHTAYILHLASHKIFELNLQDILEYAHLLVPHILGLQSRLSSLV